MHDDTLDAVLLDMMRRPGASDIVFAVGRPPQVERHGALESYGDPRAPSLLTASQTARIAEHLLAGDVELRERLRRDGAADCSFECSDGTRFRANVFTVRGEHAAVLRVLPAAVPTLAELQLPDVLHGVAALHNGLVLVTGATGSGKSTTLAALVDAINRTRPVHVLTLEDPIEFRHRHRLATVNQRELGKDFPSYAVGLRAALRQAPKVILVGELRDRESVEVALKAAETGHLVLSSAHTIDAGQSINRLVGMFDDIERSLLRSRLAEALRFVIGQRLLPTLDGGRVAALEVMGSDLSVRDLIVNGEDSDRTFYQLIAGGRAFGWQTFDQHVVEHLAAGRIGEEVAQSYCTRRSVVRQEIDRLRAARGMSTSDLGELEMEPRRRSRS